MVIQPMHARACHNKPWIRDVVDLNVRAAESIEVNEHARYYFPGPYKLERRPPFHGWMRDFAEYLVNETLRPDIIPYILEGYSDHCDCPVQQCAP